MAQKHGAVGWTETPVGSDGEKSMKDMFLRLNPGSNIIRIVTKPHQYYLHRFKVEGDTSAAGKYGHRVGCSNEGGFCPLCSKGEKSQRRWYLGVIDRKTNTSKVLDVGYSIFKGIQKYARDEDWGDPVAYDIDVVVDPNGGATSYYSLVAKPKKPLSANDQKLMEDFDSDLLDEKSAPLTSEKMQDRMNSIVEKLRSEGKLTVAAAASVAVSSGASKSVVQAASADDDDAEFTDYDQVKQPKF